MTVENNCKNCRYWEGNTKSITACCNVIDYWPNKLEKNKSFFMSVTADDDSGLNASLITGKDFGCALFEKK